MEPELSNFFEDEPPSKNYWLMFKVASYERLLQMQSGVLYMNSLDYFSTLDGEDSIALRKDEWERIYGILRAGPNEFGYSTLTIKFGDGEEIDLGPKAVLTAILPRPKNYMIFCMGSLVDGPDGIIPGEAEGKLHFDPRFLEFGSHILLIANATKFSERINAVIARERGLFSTKFFHDGHGLVSYKDLANYSGPIGVYTKDLRYSWQRELRICLGVEDVRLNDRGAYEMKIGDISDISDIIPLQALLDEPLTVNRRMFTKVGDDFQQINGGDKGGKRQDKNNI